MLSKLDCPLPGSKPSIYVNMLVDQLCMLSDISRCLLSADFYINYISCLGPGPSRHNFKQFETLSKFRA